MKNFIPALLVVAALASTASLTAQSSQSAPTTPPVSSPKSTQAAPSAPATPSTPAADSAAASPTVDEIVNKHIDAIGGKDVISKLKSVSIEGTFTMMGTENPSVTVILDGVGFKNETQFNGATIVQCYTDKGGWTINPMTGAATATPMPDDQYLQGKSQIYVADQLYDYAGKGSTVELLGKEGNAYKLKVTSKDKIDSVYLVDATTFLITSGLTKVKMQGQDIEATSKVSDYRKTELGFTMPYAIDLDVGGQFAINIAYKKVELNKEIDPAIFAMPTK